jgi:hypothetical protein
LGSPVATAAIQLALLAGLPPPRMNLSHQMEKRRRIVCYRGTEITDLQTRGNVKLLLLRMAACRCNNF